MNWFNEADDGGLLANDNHIVETPRRSQRQNIGVPPRRLIDEMSLMKHEIAEPINYGEAISCDEKNQWIDAMKNEMQALMRNEVWSLTKLPPNRKAVGCKWVYKAKTNADGSVQRFKARLVAQGYSQKFGTDSVNV